LSDVNRQPRGVVELLNFNDLGEFPRSVADSISPSLEMGSFYMLGRGLEVATGTAAAVTSPTAGAVVITIPQGEVWAIRAVNFRATNLEATAQNIAMSCLATQVSNAFVTLHSGRTSSINTTGVYNDGVAFQEPLLIPSQYAIYFNVDTCGVGLAAGFSLACSVAYHRLSR